MIGGFLMLILRVGTLLGLSLVIVPTAEAAATSPSKPSLESCPVTDLKERADNGQPAGYGACRSHPLHDPGLGRITQ